MLSDSAVRELANGRGSTYIFDLSDIDAKFYEPLFRTLQRFIPKNVDSIGFTCDHLLEARRNASSGKSFPESITRSIMKNRRHYLQNVVELLSHVILRSTRLKSVKLSNLELTLDQILRIIESISKSVSVDSLVLNRIDLGDDGLKVILRTLDSNQIRSLGFLFCHLTTKSTVPILNFIKSRTARGAGISKFDISVQEFSQNDIVKIQQALKVSGSNSPVKKSANQSNLAQNNSNEGRYETLLRENKQLKEELQRLKNSVNTVQYNDKVFVVGKGAEQFVRFLNEIGPKLQILEEQKSNIASFI